MENYNDFEMMKQGAEAKIHVGKFLGQNAIVKERFSKKYRHPDLDHQINKERLKAEVRSLMRCKAVGVRTPTIYAVEPDNGIVIMEYLEGCMTVRNFVDKNLRLGETDQLNRLAIEMGRLIAILHKNNIIHGDITTSNILVEEEDTPQGMKLCFIDFGLGYGQGTAEDKGVDLYVLERALISTHPATQFMFDQILNGYKCEYKDRKKDFEAVMAKFQEVRLRGRKREMIG